MILIRVLSKQARNMVKVDSISAMEITIKENSGKEKLKVKANMYGLMAQSIKVSSKMES